MSQQEREDYKPDYVRKKKKYVDRRKRRKEKAQRKYGLDT